MIKPVALSQIAVVMLLPFFAPCAVEAITVQFSTINLIDAAPGEDRWQYTYTVSDYTFNAGQGFTIFFDHTLYGLIEVPPPSVNGDWDISIWQPDLNLPDAGAYNALSMTSRADGASLADAFVVRFVWLGDGEPGAQLFDVYQDVPFQVLEVGETQREPDTPPWDVNRDGVVNIFDLVQVASAFGQTPPADPATDVTRDGTVNIFDLVRVASRFGETTNVSAAPSALMRRPKTLPSPKRVVLIK